MVARPSATGKVTHQLSASHTAADFLRFMKKVARAYRDRSLHLVLDTSSTHNTEEVRAWLAEHPRIPYPLPDGERSGHGRR